MVTVVARPHEISDDGLGASGVLLDGPDQFWEIDCDVVKESVVVHSFVSLNLVSLLLLFNSSKVVVFVKRKCVFLFKTLERLVSSNFSQRSHFE